ncbi:MAG: holin [Actinomycetia bacterium]|nr:holin [Actinomycetes bacterium]
MLTSRFWLNTGERAAKTLAQALLALWLAGDGALNVITVDWRAALGVAAGAALISVLTSIVSAPAADRGTPSLVRDRR